jgi:nitroreductase
MSDPGPKLDPHDLALVRSLHRATELGWGGPGFGAPARREPPIATDHVSHARRSTRSFGDALPGVETIARGLRASYGEHAAHRAVPSAGAIYGLRLHCVRRDDPPQGPRRAHLFRLDVDGALRGLGEVPAATIDALVFTPLAGPHWLVVASAALEPYVARYSIRGYRYALLEAGHWGQEVMRTFEGEGLGTVPLGSFDDVALKTVLGGRLAGPEPLYAVAVGSHRVSPGGPR